MEAMFEVRSSQYKKNSKSGFILGILFFGIFLGAGINSAEAAPIKILNNSNHAYGTIRSTLNTLLGRSYTSSEFIVDFTTSATYSCSGFAPYFSGYDPTVAIATSTTYAYCNSSSATTTPSIPYQIFSTSFTGNPGDSLATYNNFATYDITDDYAFTASPTIKMPPAFYTAPGNNAFASNWGVEWKVPTTLYGGGDLSGATAANTAFMAWLRLNHPTWNWFDVKAAVRQTASNWTTGYDSVNYGFGDLSTTTSNALTDGQILLQPPEVATSTSGLYSQLNFAVYPFRQTRRVKEVLFQFASNPGFQANELTLAQIQALGGTKITEYTGTTATTSAPIFAAVTNAYFVWFTADNSTDSAANFSRIDTYNVLGPLSQNEVQFTASFNISSPANNAISATQSPTFSWDAAGSYLGISKYQLFIDGTLDKDNISGTSATPTGNLSEGTHTWYVKAFNGGGTATTTTSTPTININSAYASGYTFYVDNVLGSDNNPGTQALPWATLSKAGLTVVAGDTVVIIKNAGQPYRETLTPTNAGTSGAPITFRGVDANSKPEIWGSDDVSGGWSVYNGGNANTYQRALTTQPGIVLVGASIASLTQKTNGASETTLNPGEWFWVSNVLYYRLASGESISDLRVEASARSNGISGGVNNITYKNIVVRYANLYGAVLSGENSIAHGIEIYDSGTGIYVGGTNVTVKYSVSARSTSYGVFLQFPIGASIYNSTFYDNAGGGGYFTALNSTRATIRNNVFSGNGGYSFSFWILTGSPSITMSHNLWDAAGDSELSTRKGTNNQELVNPLLISPGASNFALQQFSPAVDAGTAIPGLTTDILGNNIYGTPDLGGYEYQPPYSMSSGGIPIGANFRVYKNGKYLMTTATSSTATANMTITPEGGFPSGDYGEFLNVTVNSWNTSGDYSKSWTESSSAAGTTVHTVGDLAPNAFYAVSVDGTRYAQFRADSGGQGTFTYSGGYSTHTFTIAPDLSIGNGPPVGLLGTVNTQSTAASAPAPGTSTPPAIISEQRSDLMAPQGRTLTAASTTLVATSTASAVSSATTTSILSGTAPASTSPVVIKEKIVELQGRLIILLKQLVVLLTEQLQNVKKTIYQ